MAEELAELVEEADAETPSAASPSSLSELKSKMKLTGTVQRLELYGAFIDIGVGTNAILHISKLGKRVNRIADVMTVGDEVEVWIETVDTDREQVTVSMVEPIAVEWSDLKVGQVYTGSVTRLEKFGAFVDIGAEKEGLVHVSELSHDYVKHPSEAVKAGADIQVMVLGFSKNKRRIDLSRKALLEDPAAPVIERVEDGVEEEEEEFLLTSMEIALRRAMSDEPGAVVRSSRPRGKSRRPRSKRKRRQQDDILSRTLKLGQESGE